jgi:hypothetical protein
MPDQTTDGQTVSDKRATLDKAIADAFPISGGKVRKRLKQLRRALAKADQEREPCANAWCGHTRAWHRDNNCTGDLQHCPCEKFKGAEL